MAKFNLKEHIAKNKATFFSSLTEGQFSWMTQDTGQQIGSQDENMIPVYMFDNNGKYYYENDYDGYGVFGGKDYYELLDQMNGGIGDREEGIRKAFDAPAVAAGEILFPALVTDPYKFNYKTHDFTQEAETDPNQSWYEPEEDEETDYGYGFGDMDREEDYDEEELEEGYDEFKRVEKGKKKTVAKDKGEEDVYGAGVKKGEEIEKKKMKKSELKAKIKEMVLAEMELDVEDSAKENSLYDPVYESNFLAELEGMLNEAEGLTPLQDYVYQYEIEISGEDRAQDFLDDIRRLNTPQDVYDYYAYERELQDYDVNNIFGQVKRKFKNLGDDLTPLQRQAYNYTKERFGAEEAKNSLDQIKTFKNGLEFADWVYKKLDTLNEADETEKDTAEVDTTDVAVDDTETVTTSTEVEVDPDVKAVQDALTQAQVAAQKLGDKKLTDQIGNTITFFTREHVVEKPKAAVAEEASMGIKENQSSSPKLLDFVDGDDRKTLSTYKMLGFEVEVDDEVNNVYFAEMDFKGYDWMAVLAVLEDCQREGVKPNMIWNNKNYSFDEAMELADNKAASDIMGDDGVGTKLEAKSIKKSVNENTGKTLEIKTPEDLKKVEGSQIFKYDVFDREDFEQYKVYVLADDKSQAEKIAKEKFPKQFPPYKLDTGYPQKSSAAENLWTGKEKNSFWYGVEKTGAVAEGDLMQNIGKGLEYEATEEMIRDYASRLLNNLKNSNHQFDDVEDYFDFYLRNPKDLPKPMDYNFFKNNYDDILSLAMTGLDEGKKENLKETLLLQKRAGIITEAQYKEKLNEVSEDEVPLTPKVKSFINKAIADSKKDKEFENLKKADWFENELIDELIDLFPNKDYDSASKEVMDYIKDKIK